MFSNYGRSGRALAVEEWRLLVNKPRSPKRRPPVIVKVIEHMESGSGPVVDVEKQRSMFLDGLDSCLS